MSKGLAKSVVVVTGASSGVGRATALRFADEGAALVVAARRGDALDSLVEECSARGAEALAVPTDVSDFDAVEALAKAAVDRFGRIDVWVNNAAVTAFARFGEEPLDAPRRVLEVDVMGYYHGARAVLPRFRDQGSGVLINVGSVLCRVPAPKMTAYVMAKFAVRALGACLRTELVDAPGVKVCTVMPGPIDTPFFDHAANHTGWRVVALQPATSPERVASTIVGCAKRPRREKFVGVTQRLTATAYTVAPGVFERASARLVAREHFEQAPAPPTMGALLRPMAGTASTRGGWKAPSSSRLARRVAVAGGLAVAVGLGRGRRSP